ncbi:MAG TPA: glycosyltransferase [Micromonosporaceae bacterium]|jgi:alpha-1,6-mannosyltransferase
MRIVQFANFYAPTSGGLRTFVEETGRGYTGRGHTRLLVVPGPADLDEQTPSGRRLTIASPSMFGSDEYRMVTAHRRVLQLFDEFRPDVLEISDKLAVTWLSAWARRRGVPTVLFSHERIDAVLRTRLPGRFAARGPVPVAADAVNRALRKRVDRVVVASAFAAEEFARAGVTDVHRVPLGVDHDTFCPVQDSTVERDGIELVLVSRLSAEKSPQLAVEALRRLWAAGTPVRLTVIGDGPLVDRITALAAGLPVRFLGHVAQRSRLARLIGQADVAICPSTAETFGLATLEALACGTPVVVPDQGALPELVRGAPEGAGVICMPTPDEFADGVRTLLAVAPAGRRAAARSVALRYPWERTVGELVSLHAGLVAAPACA